MAEALLAVTGVSKQFLGLRAVDNVSLSVRQGEIVSIIGPNGAGKTTFFNLLTGQLAPTEGEVRLRGKRINELAPHARARLGMGRTFQIAKPLIALNALENVMIGAFMRHPKLSVARDKAMSVLEEVSMGHLARRRAGDLTLSERRRLEVARAGGRLRASAKASIRNWRSVCGDGFCGLWRRWGRCGRRRGSPGWRLTFCIA